MDSSSWEENGQILIQHDEEWELVIFATDSYQSLHLRKMFGGCLLDLPLCSFSITSLGDLQCSAFQSLVVKEVARVVNQVSLIRSFANTFK